MSVLDRSAGLAYDATGERNFRPGRGVEKWHLARPITSRSRVRIPAPQPTKELESNSSSFVSGASPEPSELCARFPHCSLTVPVQFGPARHTSSRPGLPVGSSANCGSINDYVSLRLFMNIRTAAFMKIERPRSRQPLPDHAKLVFKGVMFDVYQWEQKLYDGSSATFERLKRPDTVMVIPVTEDGRIIITRQEQPGRAASFCLPGGRVDEAEDVLSAAKRELMEETGYESETWSLWDSQQPVLKIEWAIFTFVARGCRKTAGLTLDAGEKINLQDVSFEEFVELIVNGDFSDHELVPRFLRARLHPNGMEDLKREILG